MSAGPARRALAQLVDRLGLRSAVGTAVAWLFDTVRVPPPGLRAGKDLPREVADRRPVAIVVLLGADETAVAETVTALAGLLAEGAARPVLLLDRPHFALARRAGLAVDHLVSREQWQEQGWPGRWEDHLAWRVERLRRDYAASVVLALPPEGVRALDPAVVGSLLRPSAPGRVARAWTAAVTRAQRLLDQPG